MGTLFSKRSIMISKIITHIISYVMMFIGILYIIMTTLLKLIGIKEEK
tara:strand:+ start:1564 stop:1707 length:144 start_codon:yes stop_codon:yes gene_type:complete